ncbi:NAD(P)H nitroreductase [Bacillus thuringiensis serovar israelensis ATCC 35646]|nr:NAD(P)H nitroreductase [Bacillus thuringiensis serovar israelensis ATCC 35646]
MNYEGFKEVIHGRRRVRTFTEQEVSTNDLHAILDCARYAPSDKSSPTWDSWVL